MVSIILMNVIIAVVLEGYSSVQKHESIFKYESQVHLLKQAWLKRDPTFSGCMNLDDLVPVMLSIPEPVGFHGRKRKHVLHQMRWLMLHDGRKVHFRDVI